MATPKVHSAVNSMTLQRFQGLVLKLGNQMFVRHYLWVNYPNEPQLLGIQFAYNPKEERRKFTRTCDCGQCKKCKHREYVRKTRAVPETDRLYAELRSLGFQWNEALAMWTIQREVEVGHILNPDREVAR